MLRVCTRYYRLLKYDVHEAARVVHGVKVIVDAFVDADDTEVKNRIFEEFNKLSVLYKMPAERFINLNLTAAPSEPAEAQAGGGDGSEGLVAAEDAAPATPPSTTAAATPSGASAAADAEVDFLGAGTAPAAYGVSVPVAAAAPPVAVAVAAAKNDFDLLDLMTAPTPAPAVVAAPAAMQLVPRPVVDPPLFQSRWMSLPLGGSSKLTVKQGASAQFEALLGKASILTMASGTVNGMTKLYSFAQEV